MKLFKVVIVAIIAITVVSCGPTQTDVQDKISGLETAFSDQSQGLSKEKAQELVNAYVEYFELFPNDSLSPEYLFKAADISMNVLDARKAIAYYDDILNNFPEFRKAPQCVFLKAFVYENNLNDLNRAKKYYLEFLEKYPNDDFADDAQISLDNLGKSPEELIKEFEEKMKEQEEAGE